MLSRSLLRAAVAACAAVIPSIAAAQTQTLTFDAAQSFFALNTAASPFAAGYVAQGDYLGALTPYTARSAMTYTGGTTPQVLNVYNAGPFVPGVFLAGATGYDQDPNFTPKFGPNVLGLHPGANGEMSVIRFTAPVSGVYTIHFSGFGLDASGPNGGTTSDENLALPDPDYGYLLYGGSINGFGYADSGQTFDLTNVDLNAGQFFDFAVGYGDNAEYSYDMTALDARVSVDVPATTTPEPATVALVGAGVLALGAAARRRRQV